MLTAGGSLFLVSLLLKESFIAGGAVLAAVAYTSSCDRPWKYALKAFGVSAAAVLVYAALRYTAMGWKVNYTESSRFGPFMIKNILVQNAAVWRPWLTGISARVLFLLIPVFIYFSAKEWKHRILLILSGVCLLVPVSNLPSRIDLAVAALPAAALTIALFTERYGSSHLFRSLILVFFAGVILSSADELKLLEAASDTLDRETIMIAGIAGDLPGEGPIFITGVTEEIGGYGTFWPGEYMMPLRCAGIEPSRSISGTDAIWEQLIQTDETGYIVFLGEGAEYRSYPVSRNMYSVFPDTTVQLHGPTDAGCLSRYPSCFVSDVSECVYLVMADSLITLFPHEHRGEFCVDLAASPEWLCADSTSVLIYHGEVTFTGRNLALEKALNSMEMKDTYRM